MPDSTIQRYNTRDEINSTTVELTTITADHPDIKRMCRIDLGDSNGVGPIYHDCARTGHSDGAEKFW